MGKKDLWQSDYFDDKKRFADMINGAFFKGKQVIKEEELEETDSNLVYHDNNGEAVNVIRDKVYKWKGQNVAICVLENQSYVDYRMVFRVMLEEAVSYMKQQKRAYKKWKEAGYKFDQNEFLSKMRKEEKYTPVITLVLYLGKEKWDGVKSLHEMLDIDEELKPFVTNHKINLFDYHEYEEFSRFKTENRYIFELLTYSGNETETERIIKKYLNDYCLDEESVKAIFGMLDIKADINKYKTETKKGVKYHMCKAWDDHMERGRQEGYREGCLEGEQATIKKSLKVLIDSLKKFSADLEMVYNAVVENELYKDITKEQVEKYYYAK